MPLTDVIDDKVLDISLNHLELEAKRQPRLVWAAGKNLAQARKDAKLARRELRVKKAELKAAIRRSPASYRIESPKPTVGEVEDACDKIPEVARMELAVIDREYEEELLEAFTKALASKDRHLENAVKLHGQMYFSKPDTSGQAPPSERRRAEATRQVSEPPRPRPPAK